MSEFHKNEGTLSDTTHETQNQRLLDPNTFEEELLDDLTSWLNNVDEKSFAEEQLDHILKQLDYICPLDSSFDIDASLSAVHQKFSTFSATATLIAQNSVPKSTSSRSSSSRQTFRLQLSKLSSVAAALAVIFICLGSVQVAGYDILGYIAHWTKEVFQLQGTTTASDHIINSNLTQYEDLHNTLDEVGIAIPIAPSWIPNDFKNSAIDVNRLPGYLEVAAQFTSGNRCFFITATQFVSEENINNVFEKDETPVSLYEKAGIIHYIMGNNGQTVVVWSNGPVACSIRGDITEEEATKMIDSIYLE